MSSSVFDKTREVSLSLSENSPSYRTIELMNAFSFKPSEALGMALDDVVKKAKQQRKREAVRARRVVKMITTQTPVLFGSQKRYRALSLVPVHESRLVRQRRMLVAHKQLPRNATVTK
jgi:hypothetical protein